MPFKSKAQRRKFAELLLKGEITPEQFEEWNRETGSAELPERVKPKKRAAKPRQRKSAGGTKRTRKAARKKPKSR
jgi:macrodomain Ter protein organizer (MatP/YcbG family)